MTNVISATGDTGIHGSVASEPGETLPNTDRFPSHERKGPAGSLSSASRSKGSSSTQDSLPFTWEQAFAATGDGLLVIDRHRRILYGNRVAEALYDRPSGGLHGLTFDDLYPPSLMGTDPNPLDLLLEALRRDNGPIIEEFRCPFNRRWYETRVHPVPLPGDSGGLIVIRDIDALRSAQDRFERTVTATRDGIAEIDHLRDRAYFSSRWREMTDSHDLPAEANEAERIAYWWQRIHPEDLPRVQAHHECWRFGNEPFDSITFRLRFLDDDGCPFYRWFIERGYVERDEEGQPVRTTGVLTDITLQKETESLLSFEKARFERAMDAADEGLWESDFTIPTEDGEGVTYRSPAWKTLLGVNDGPPPPDDPYYRKAFVEKLHPEDRPGFARLRHDCIFGGKPFPRIEFRLLQPDGAYRWFVIRGKTHRAADGELLRITGVLADIHDRKQAELDLKAAHARFERAVAATHDGIWEHDFVRGVHYRSPRWKEMADIPDDIPDDFPSLETEEWRTFWQPRIHPEDWEQVETHRRDHIDPHSWVEPTEFRLRHRSGEFRWVRERFRVERDEQGHVLRLVGVIADIHDRKTAELELASRERFLTQVARALPNILYVYDRRNHSSVYVNERLADILGYSEEDLRTTTGGIPELIHPDDLESFHEQSARIDALADNEFAILEFRVRHKYGEYRWIRNRIVPFGRDENGVIVRTVGVAEDITEFKRQESVSREATARFERAIEASRDAVWEMHIRSVTEPSRNTLYRSPQFWKLFGFDSVPEDNIDPVTGRWPEFDGDDVWQSRIHPDDYERLRAYRNGVFDSVIGTTETEYRILRNDGQYRWISSRSRVERAADGTPFYLTGVITDIHDRKEAEQRIRQSEARYRTLVDSVHQGVWRAAPDGRILYCNDTLYAMVRGDADDIGDNETAIRAWSDLVHPEDRPALEDRWRTCRESGAIFEGEFRLATGRADCSYRRCSVRAVPVRDDRSAIREWIGVVQDITERVEAAEALARSEARYRLITEASVDGIFRVSPEGNLLDASSHLLRALGLQEMPEGGFTRSALRAFLHPEEIEDIAREWRQATKAGTRLELQIRIGGERTGYRRWQVRAVPLRNDRREIAEWVGAVSDITERFEAEARLRESETRLKEAQRITQSGHFRQELSLISPGTDPGTAPLHDFWSDEMYRIFERDPAAGPPSRNELDRYFASEDRLRMEQAQERVRRNGMRHMAELPIRTERGIRKWLQIYHRADRDEEGKVIALYGAVVDITAFKAMEESLRQAQQLARRIALAIPDLLYVYDLEGGQTRYANRSIAQLLGFGPEDPELLVYPDAWIGVGDHVSAFLSSRLHPADSAVHLAMRQRLSHLADGEVIEVIVRMRHKDGTWRTLFCREMVFTRHEITGEPREILGVAQDITEKVEAEEQRRESEEKYRNLVDLLSDWVWESDADGRYRYVSGQVTRRLGFRPEEMLGVPIADFAPPSAREIVQLTLGGFAQRKQPFTRVPLEVIDIVGETVYLEISGVPILGADGSFQGYRGVAYDVTQRKQGEDLLRNSEERTRRIIESSPDCMQILDMNGYLLSVNETGRRLLAITDVEGVRGAYWPSFWDGEWRQVAEDAVRRAAIGETRRFLGFTRSLNGDGRWWDVVVTALPDAEGRSEQLLVVSRDISAQKTLEQQKDQLLADAMQRAERDPLTGLFDHQAFHKRLQEEGKRSERDGSPFAVAVLDVDNFKYFNDAFGHLEGDAVLLHITNALRSTCRPTDTIGRLGGDEFAVILAGVTKQDAVRLLESRLRDNAFASRWQPRGYDAPIPLGISFGVAVYPDEATTPLAALSLADERLYRNKKEGQAGLLPHLRAELAETMVGFPMLDSLVTAVDSKDRYTRKHSEDVLIYAVMIGQVLNLSEEDLGLLSPAALLHDVGKIGVSQRILRLPTSLTAEEYEAIKQHAPLGAALVEVLLTHPSHRLPESTEPDVETILESISDRPIPQLPLLELPGSGITGENAPRLVPPEQRQKLVAAVRHHHEAWDGTGYPDGIRGENIPILARILAVADAFSAMTTDRPYRRGADRDKAMAVLRQGAGTQWDPECVAAFMEVAQASFSSDITPVLAAFEALTATHQAEPRKTNRRKAEGNADE